MQAVDIQGQFGEIFLDPNRLIPEAHLKTVCKKGQGHSTCRYISLAVKGFVCVKNSPLERVVDQQVEEKHFTASGNNCEGFGKVWQKNKSNAK